MKDYPSINGINRYNKAPLGQSCIAFRKLDGSNLRFEWSKKRGWHLFGTRIRTFDRSDPEYGCAINIFERKYADAIVAASCDFRDFKKPQGLVAFCEFFGPHSFAGWHDPTALQKIGFDVTSNEPKELVLFDVNINKRGLRTVAIKSTEI